MSKDSIDNVYMERLDTEDPHMEKRVLRKVDIRLLPILMALYVIALVGKFHRCAFTLFESRSTKTALDRTNISVARISGLDDDLSLEVGNRASVALLASSPLNFNVQALLLTARRFSSSATFCSNYPRTS